MRLRDRQPAGAWRPSSSSSRAAIVSSTRRRTSSWWRRASVAAACAATLAEERLADLVDGGAEGLRAAQREPDAQPGEAVDLREGPQQDEVGMGVEQVDGRVGVVERVELAVGLVDDHADVSGTRSTNAAMSASGSAVPVGLFGLQTITIRVATVTSSAMPSRSWRSSSSSGDDDRARAGRGRHVRVHRERRPRVDHLGAGLEQRRAGGQQHVARAVAERDARAGDAVAVGERAPQAGAGRIGIAVRALGGLRGRRATWGSGANGDSLLARWATRRERVAVGGRVDRDAAGRPPRTQRHQAAPGGPLGRPGGSSSSGRRPSRPT